MNRKRGGCYSALIYEEVATIATIVDLVTEDQPAIKEPLNLACVEYGKMGGDYVLSIFCKDRKPEGITLNDTADLDRNHSKR